MTEVEACVARPGNRAGLQQTIGGAPPKRRAPEHSGPTLQRLLDLPSCAGGSIAIYLSTAFSKWRTRIS